MSRLASILVAVAFVGLLVCFGLTVFAFRANVERWARRDLMTQAELTAENLSEPLRTQDFRRLQEIAQQLAAKEMLLGVRTARGGWIFKSDYKGRIVEESTPCGEYRVSVALSAARVHQPFYDALGGFLLAALVGILAMGVVFFTLYRQRVRIGELKKLEKFRRDFIADFSHELKTPLTGILGAAEMLGEGRLQEMIRKEATRLNDLSTAMLDLAKLEHDTEVLRRESLDVTDLIREVHERFADEAAAAGVKLIVSSSSSAVGRILADRMALIRAISNLVMNALRHSGGSDIEISAEKVGRGVRFIVADNGCGVPLADRKRIFDRFVRVDTARTTPGTGLGLAIVKGIARLHGGDAWYEANEPLGARFILTIKK